MPETRVVMFRDAKGTTPVRAWLASLPDRPTTKCIALIAMLQQRGVELHRPHADYLREGIYELRTRVGRVNYRILYFFHGQEAVVLSQGFTKEKDVPKAEIEKAIANREVFEKNPKRHTEEVSAKE